MTRRFDESLLLRSIRQARLLRSRGTRRCEPVHTGDDFSLRRKTRAIIGIQINESAGPPEWWMVGVFSPSGRRERDIAVRTLRIR